MDMNLSKLWEIVKDRDAWHATVHGVTLSLPLGLALGSPIFPSGCEGEGKLGVALESLQGLRELT